MPAPDSPFSLNFTGPFIAVTGGVRSVPGLAHFLGEVIAPPRHPSPGSVVLAWGRKPSALRALAYAKRHGLPVLWLEDGFLRSLGLGTHGHPPISLVLDDRGIYYDATGPSRLEECIRTPLTDEETTRARALAELWRSERVSKYNHAREVPSDLPERFVLAIDQTAGDASIHCGLATGESFARMLKAALAHPGEEPVVLKVHPEVVAGTKKGHFCFAEWRHHSRLRLLAEDCPAPALLERATAVYTVTSQMGFEALLWEREVHTFGFPFYAGWGCTRDHASGSEVARARARRTPVAWENVVWGALSRYPRYLDLESGHPVAAAEAIRWMGWQIRQRARFPAHFFAPTIPLGKQAAVRKFLPGSRVRFGRGRPRGHEALLLWGAEPVPSYTPLGVSIWRVEDGFVRSVGLGAGLVEPVSWVFDQCGMYFDATRPSQLEHILASTSFDGDLLARARALRERIEAGRISKYNTGSGGVCRPVTDRKVILVPGQVESDASILLGSPRSKTNMALLRAVRDSCPDAFVIYKPHPDVLAGWRAPGRQENRAAEFCDQVVTTASMPDLLEVVDEVHTMTSLTGFEALLRGKRVVVYGQPFYSGWGLTDDRCPVLRRQRRLTLDELVAGTLLLYPVYLSRRTGAYIPAEQALEQIAAWKQRQKQERFPLLARAARFVRAVWAAWRQS